LANIEKPGNSYLTHHYKSDYYILIMDYDVA